MKLVESYRVVWHVSHGHGSILLQTEDGIVNLEINSSAEGSFVLDMLRNEKPVYTAHDKLFSGFEIEPEGKAKAKKSKAKAK